MTRRGLLASLPFLGALAKATPKAVAPAAWPDAGLGGDSFLHGIHYGSDGAGAWYIKSIDYETKTVTLDTRAARAVLS